MIMKHVEIYKLQNNGEQTVIATCSLDSNGMVVCEGDTVFIGNLEKEGIRDYGHLESRSRVFPKDGIEFLGNLKHAFRSGYLVATDIQE